MEPLDLAPIDQGEKWAAILGIKPVLSKRVEKITDGQIVEVANLPETIRKRARSLVRDGIVSPPFPLVDYEKVLANTADDIDIPQIEAMIRPIPGDDQLPYMTVAKRTYVALQAAVPKAAWSTFAGTENLPPDLTALVKLSEFYGALEDPVSFIFGGIADGSIDREIAQAVKLVFPTLTAAITSAIQDAVTEQTMKRKGWTLPWKAEIGMAAWLGQPPEAPAALPQAAPSTPQKPTKQGKDTSALTPAERIEAGV